MSARGTTDLDAVLTRVRLVIGTAGVNLPSVHELVVMQGVVETALRHAGGAPIVTLRLELGQLAGVAVEALRFCFDVCSRDTALEGAVLEITELPARTRCRACGLEAGFETWVSACACGSRDRELVCGQEIKIKELEVIDVS